MVVLVEKERRKEFPQASTTDVAITETIQRESLIWNDYWLLGCLSEANLYVCADDAPLLHLLGVIAFITLIRYIR